MNRTGIVTPRCYSKSEVYYFDLSKEHVGTRVNLRIFMREKGGRVLGFRDVPVNLQFKCSSSNAESEKEAEEDVSLMLNASKRFCIINRTWIVTPHCYTKSEVHYFDLSKEHVGTSVNLRIVVREKRGRVLGFRDVPVNLRFKCSSSNDESEKEAEEDVSLRGFTHQRLPTRRP
ncbi:hypothetical protein MRX96_000957 [Rhipicephalus microplus]